MNAKQDEHIKNIQEIDKWLQKSTNLCDNERINLALNVYKTIRSEEERATPNQTCTCNIDEACDVCITSYVNVHQWNCKYCGKNHITECEFTKGDNKWI